MPHDLRTKAIVLRRTNYGESDRIINLLTPDGKIAVLAKGVRKEKSRLAGGIELFSVADIVVHQGRSNLGTLTSAKMLCFYKNILTDIVRLELASECLKKVERAAEQVDNPEYFELINQVLAGLDKGVNMDLVRLWFAMNLAQAMGEEINLATDVMGSELEIDQRYFWDRTEVALRINSKGMIGAQEIKLARVILQNKLFAVAKIAQVNELIRPLEMIGRAFW